MQTCNVDVRVSEKGKSGWGCAGTNFFTQHLPRYRVFRGGGFRKLKAGIKNEETGAEGIEPIVKGSHKLKQEDWERVEKRKWHTGGWISMG